MTVERVRDDPERAASLIAAGGRLERHSVVMTLDLTDPPPPAPLADGFSIAAMDPTRAAEYGEVVRRAYPPEHPDHDAGDADPESATKTVGRYISGEEVGPWIAAASLHVVDHTDRIVGAVVINEAPASPAFDAGPFVTDVFVDPDANGNGLGAAMLATSARRLAELGWPMVALAVTVGNPAQRVYERLGYRVTFEAWRIMIED